MLKIASSVFTGRSSTKRGPDKPAGTRAPPDVRSTFVSPLLFLAAADPLLPIRIVAGIALLAVIVAFVYVLRHLRSIEQTIVKDNMIPTQHGARTNVVLIVCAIPIVVVALLVFLLTKA